MKIGGYSSINSNSGVRKGGFSPVAGAFSDFMSLSEADGNAPAGSLGDVSGLVAMGNLLAMQEVSDQDVRRKKMVQHGKSTLDILERLRQQLLIGAVPLELLRDLNRQLEITRQFQPDARLSELLDDIELRAAVELAKLERAAELAAIS